MQQTTTFTMREPCRRCGWLEGTIEPRGAQDCVFCRSCGVFAYNAPRVETGRKPRSISTTRNGVRPSQRARVLMRANGRCEFCGNRTDLTVEHLLSVTDGVAEGLTDAEINHDENLAAFCPECNAGKGSASATARFFLALLIRRHVAEASA